MARITLRYFLLLVLTIASFHLFFNIDNAEAAQIKKIKGKKVLILDEDSELKPGDTVYALNSQGKKRAKIKILKTKNKKAIGQLVKGRAKSGWQLVMKSSSVRTQKKSSMSKAEKPIKQTNKQTDHTNSKMHWGVLLGYSIINMESIYTTQIGKVQKTASMKGNGFSGKALLDYSLWESIWFRGLAGLEQFSADAASDADGGSSCGAADNEVCDIAVNYLSLDLWGRYLLSLGTMRPWLGVGFNLMLPASKKSSAIDEATIGSTSIIAVGGGLDWHIGDGKYIPLQVEYNIYPKSDSVSASSIVFRAGLSFPF